MPGEAQPHVRSARIFLILVAFSIALIVYSGRKSASDIAVASGPTGEAQKQFFVDAASRPDALTLFERMTPVQRLKTAQNLGHYSGPEVAKLAVVLLDSFDPEARTALAKSLAAMAAKSPEDVALQLDKTSSYQTEGLFGALRSAGPAALPEIAESLEVEARRANAARLMVEIGSSAVGELRRVVRESSGATRLAAAEALSKLKSREATQELLAAMDASKGDERLELLADVCGIGDPATEGLLVVTLEDASVPLKVRQQAALGLGRVGTPKAVRTLVASSRSEDSEFADAAWAGLAQCGEVALGSPVVPFEAKVRVAANLRSTRADHVLIQGLRLGSREIRLLALDGCSGRTNLVAAVAASLVALEPAKDGDLIEAAIDALCTTPEGKSKVKALSGSGNLAGFAMRALARG